VEEPTICKCFLLKLFGALSLISALEFKDRRFNNIIDVTMIIFSFIIYRFNDFKIIADKKFELAIEKKIILLNS
jgi:hypothetical protein